MAHNYLCSKASLLEQIGLLQQAGIQRTYDGLKLHKQFAEPWAAPGEAVQALVAAAAG